MNWTLIDPAADFDAITPDDSITLPCYPGATKLYSPLCAPGSR
jgi:hypothetical protein